MINEIRNAEKKLIAAIKNNDVNALEELLHDDLLFNLPHGETITKEMDINTHRFGDLKIDDILTSDEKISIIEDTAVITLNVQLKGKYLDQILDGRFKYLRVWKVFNNEWKIIAGSCSQVNE